MRSRKGTTRALTMTLIILMIAVGMLTAFNVTRINVSGKSALLIDGTAQNDLYGVTSVTISLTTLNYPDVIYVIVSAPVNAQFSINDSSHFLSWTERTVVTYGGSSPISLEAWYAISDAPLTSDSITVTASTSSNLNAIGWGISGANVASPFDSNLPVKSSGASYKASVSITTANSNDMIIGSVAQRGTASATPESGFSDVVSPSGYPLADAEYQIVSTTQSSLLVSFSLVKNYPWAMIGDAIVAAASTSSSSTTTSTSTTSTSTTTTSTSTTTTTSSGSISTVNSSLNSEATADPFERKTWTAQGLDWVFYYDGVQSIDCSTSSNGISWSSPLAIASNKNINNGETFSTWYNYTTNTFYYVYSNNTGFRYGYGQLSPNGCSGLSLTESGQHILYNASRWPFIAATSTGNIWVDLTSFDSKGFVHIEVWKNSSGTWSNVKDINTSSTTHAHAMILPLSSGSKWSLVYGDDSSKHPLSVSITTNSGTSWTAPTQSAYTTTAPFDSAAAIGDTTFVLYRHGVSYYFYSVSITGARSAQKWVASLSTPISGSSISVNATTGQITVIYANQSSVYYRFSANSGTSFGSQQVLSNTGNSINTFTICASYYQGPNDYTSVVWTNGASSPFMVRYGAT